MDAASRVLMVGETAQHWVIFLVVRVTLSGVELIRLASSVFGMMLGQPPMELLPPPLYPSRWVDPKNTTSYPPEEADC